ncbi:bactofilin family protein [Gemmobacter aquaticus]|nr:polymer-forming cytoskeletal protein [Gemmobacter aquaticus]
MLLNSRVTQAGWSKMAGGTAVTVHLPEPAQAGAKPSVLAQDLVVDGEITSLGPVDLRGTVTGQVRAPDILIAPTGAITGAATAYDLTIQGQVSGTIEAQNVMLSSTAIVRADVTHERIAIEPGAQLEGQLKRQR